MKNSIWINKEIIKGQRINVIYEVSLIEDIQSLYPLEGHVLNSSEDITFEAWLSANLNSYIEYTDFFIKGKLAYICLDGANLMPPATNPCVIKIIRKYGAVKS